MGGVKKKGGGSREEREMKETLAKKCRILAKMWDPRIKGCCFVPGKAERCCAIPLQVGTRLNAVAVCLYAIAFQVFYGIGFGTMEYYHVQATSALSVRDAAYCGIASADYGFDSCLVVYIVRLAGDLLLIGFCVAGFISAPCEPITPNLLETRHCQATTFFIGLCVGLVFHVAAMLYGFVFWASGVPELCLNDTTENLGAPSPWGEIFCESGSLVQALLAVAQMLFIVYVLYVMLITLAYRGWLIILEMKQNKGFRSIDWSQYDEEEEAKPKGSSKVAPAPADVDNELEKALEGMLAEEGGGMHDALVDNEQNPDEAWIEAEDEDGNTYYTNFITGESAWSLPTAHLDEVKGMFDDVIDQSDGRDDTIETVYKRFRTGEGKDGLIDYDEFCKVLQVDANEQVKKLFNLFDEDQSGKLTIKEFVVGVCNFTGKDTSKKVEFAFKVFDEDNDGFIDVEELAQILRAIHMAKDEQEVQRKAKLIMAKSDLNKDGVMSFDEFVAISKKFPNILFPAFNLSNQLGEKLGFT